MRKLYEYIKINKYALSMVVNMILLIVLAINVYGNITLKNKFVELTGTYNELLQENQNQKIQLNDLFEKIKQLEFENSAYKEQQSKNIDVNSINPHSKSNLSVEVLNKMLINTGLESQGQAFYDMENTYNVNALFVMGVAMHESANGYQLANTYNYFGFRGNNGWMSFSSPYECIQYFGKLIHNNYSNRPTISAIQSKYCPNNSSWTSRVKEHMNQLKQKI